MHDAAASFPILHAMFFSLPLLLLTKMPIPQGVDETHLEAMSTEYEYYDEGIPIQVLHTIQKANIRRFSTLTIVYLLLFFLLVKYKIRVFCVFWLKNKSAMQPEIVLFSF
jgi:hypothetical protein